MEKLEYVKWDLVPVTFSIFGNVFTSETGNIKLGFLIVCSTNFMAFFHLVSSDTSKQVMA